MKKSSNLKLIVLFLVVSFFPFAGNAQGSLQEKFSGGDKQGFEDFVFDSIYGEDPHEDLLIREKSLYVDLAAELGRLQQDRKRMREIKKEKEEISSKAEELDVRLAELKKIQEELEQKVTNKEKGLADGSEPGQSLKLLVDLYGSIKPADAADLLKRMPIYVSLATMRMMAPRNASKILSAMDPKFAAEVSRRLLQSPYAGGQS